MISAVLDANMIASGMLGYRSHESIPGGILRFWRKNTFTLVTSKYIRDEVKNVLHKSYFTSHLSPSEISRIQTLLLFQAKQAAVTKVVHGIATHPEDDLVLATAISARADYLVTGDKPLLQKTGGSYQNISIVNPVDFFQILKQQS